MEANNETFDTFQPIGLAANRVVAKLGQANKLSVSLMSGNSESRRCIIKTSKRAEAFNFSISSYLSCPSFWISGGLVDAFDATCRTRLAVESVLLIGRFPEICDAIIRLVAIDVVDEVCWPTVMNVKPRQAMCWIGDPFGPNNAVPAMDHAGFLSPKSGIGSVRPDENAGISRVMQKLSDSFGSKKIVERSHFSPEDNKDVPAERDSNGKDGQEERNETQRAYIEQRLRDTIAFERRFQRKN